MMIAAPPELVERKRVPRREGSCRRKLAALAGAAGAVAAGAGEAEAVPYTPTAGVVAAQGIPGFSFVSDTNVTLGSLRPPAALASTAWDVDGSGTMDFSLLHFQANGIDRALFNCGLGADLAKFTVGSTSSFQLQNLLTGVAVNSALSSWENGQSRMTFNGVNSQTVEYAAGAGQFGFRFSSNSDTFYGWGSLVIDGTPAGQGFTITEAYYNNTPGGAIAVGAVPQAVPEPAGIALLALGAAGVAAWRARRARPED